MKKLLSLAKLYFQNLSLSCLNILKKTVLKIKQSLLGVLKFLKIMGWLLLLASLGLLIWQGAQYLMSLMAKDFRKTISESIVLVSNQDGIAGGTGFIMKQTDLHTIVLTNAHVCNAFNKAEGSKQAPIIHTNRGTKHIAVNAQIYSHHDLCALKILSKVGRPLKIADQPSPKYAKTFSVGYPLVIGQTMYEGSVSDIGIIKIPVGLEKCTEKDFDSKDAGLIMSCIFLGGKPVYQDFEALVYSGGSSPGSSGSPLLNEQGEVVGVVFAGSKEGGPLTLAVPWHFLVDFVSTL